MQPTHNLEALLGSAGALSQDLFKVAYGNPVNFLCPVQLFPPPHPAPVVNVNRNVNQPSTDEDSEVRKNAKRAKIMRVAKGRWTELEDVILTGLVLRQIHRRYSLKPTTAEIQTANESKLPCNTMVWRSIHEEYRKVCERFTSLTGYEFTARTHGALQKRWKENSRAAKNVLGEQFGGNGSGECDEDEVPLMKKREKLWDDVVNNEFILTCPDQKFVARVKSGFQYDFNTFSDIMF